MKTDIMKNRVFAAAAIIVILTYGAGFRDLKWPVYWGRIPGILKTYERVAEPHQVEITTYEEL